MNKSTVNSEFNLKVKSFSHINIFSLQEPWDLEKALALAGYTVSGFIATFVFVLTEIYPAEPFCLILSVGDYQ